MKQRTIDEMITYFNQQVDKMDIDRKYKMALLGMITAIGYENKKQERKTGRWINVNDGKWNTVTVFKCSACGEIDNRMYETDNYCPHCGAKMEVD